MSTSLQLLAPRPWASGKNPSTYTRETAKHIQRISIELMALASSRQWTHPLFQKYISPSYHAEFDHAGGVPLHTWQAYIEHHDRLAEKYPEYRFEALDSVSDVYEKNGTGSVYLLLRVTGQPSSVVRESIIVHYWERGGGGDGDGGGGKGEEGKCEGEVKCLVEKEEGGEEEMERWTCVGQKVVRGMLWNA